MAYVNLTGRMDLTSTLPYKNAQYFYPGISTSLVWSEILQAKPNWLDYAKVRAGYARVGNDAGPHNGEPIFGLSAAVIAAWAGAGVWALVLQRLAWSAFIMAGAWTACGWRPGSIGPARTGEDPSRIPTIPVKTKRL